MGEEELLAEGWGTDYGVGRAEQWRRRRRRSINNSASEQRGGGGDSLPPFVPPSLPRAQESRCRVQQGGRGPTYCRFLHRTGRSTGTFAKFHFTNDGRLSSAQTARLVYNKCAMAEMAPY